MKIKKLIILVELNDNKVYQVALKEGQMLDIISDLPNLYPDGKIKLFDTTIDSIEIK